MSFTQRVGNFFLLCGAIGLLIFAASALTPPGNYDLYAFLAGALLFGLGLKFRLSKSAGGPPPAAAPKAGPKPGGKPAGKPGGGKPGGGGPKPGGPPKRQGLLSSILKGPPPSKTAPKPGGGGPGGGGGGPPPKKK